MNTDDLVTDMAQDVLEKRAPDLPAETKRLSCGIVARRLDLTSETQAKRLGRERGIYLTFDCTEGTFASGGGAGVLSRHIARAVVDMAGVMGRRSVVLAAGLGNAGVTADSLGAATTELLDVSPVSEAERKRQKVRLCAVNAGVEGRTGIRSADVVAGVCVGYLVDRFSPGKVAFPAIVMSALFVLGQGFAPTLAVLGVSRFFTFVTAGGLEPVFLTMLSKASPPERRGQIFGWSSTSRTCGLLLAAPFGGTMIYHFGVRSVYVVAACGFLILIPFVMHAMKLIQRNSSGFAEE